MVIIGSHSIASGVIYVPLETFTYTGGSNLSSYTTISAGTLKMATGSNYGSLFQRQPIGGAKSISLLQ